MDCFNCGLPFSTIKEHMEHLQTCVDPYNKSYNCAFGGCTRKFCLKKSYRNHLTKHLTSASSDVSHELTTNASVNIVSEQDSVHQPFALPIGPDLNAALLDLAPENFKKDVMKFVLSLYGDQNMSRKAALQIIDTYRNTWLKLLNALKKVITFLNNSEKVIEFINDMVFFFSKSGIFSSEYKIFQELERVGILIKPKQITIHIENTQKYYVQTIPLRNIFENLFQNNLFFTEVLKYIQSFSSEKIQNIMQTDVWHNKLKYLDQTTTLYLPLLVFFDDLEVLNALGSHSGVYKLGATYIHLACLPESLQSKVKMIFLGLLFFSEDRKMVGNKRIFQSLIDQLNELFDEGIQVEYGIYKNIKFIPVLIIGDNLGLHQILGFVEGFNASHYCRFCTLSISEIRKGTFPKETDLRTADNYEDQVALCDPKSTGITEMCVFNDLRTYHVIESPSVDIMHDFQEGGCHYIVCKILLQFINEDNYFTLDTLNHLINIFDYGPIDINKPNLITMNMLTNNRLKNSASEMMSFCTYLPFIIGHLIDEHSPYWDLFISLRTVMNIIFKKSYSPGTPDLVQSLIKELIEKYVACFGWTLPPKLHFSLHSSMVMKNVGPLANISCNRYEAKHQQFTKISKPLQCRKNFTYSLALKHQLILANYLQNIEFSEKIECGHTKTDFIPSISENEVNVCSFVMYSGFKLRKNVVVQIDVDEDLMPVFGLIKYIIDVGENCFEISCIILENLGFNEHYFAYEIVETQQSVTKRIKQLVLERISTVCVNAKGCKMVTWG